MSVLDIAYTIYTKFEEYPKCTPDCTLSRQHAACEADNAFVNAGASAGASVDSARQNLAATFVNAFVNAGFGQDKLMTVPSEASSGGTSGNWLFKNKEHGKASVAASLGMILLWDVDAGLAQIDKYFHSNDNHVIAGALLGVGVVNCGIKNGIATMYNLILKLIQETYSLK